MTYKQKFTRGKHSHRWFIDANTGDKVCLCGVTKGREVKRSKYHNKTNTYNGVLYDSILEARYAAELDFRLKCKDIKGWERQVKLELKVNGYHICNYYIDFIVDCFDHFVFTEIKGMELRLWQQKWRLLEATFEDHKRTPDDEMLVVKQV